VRLYDRFFQVADPTGDGDDFVKHLNPKSLEILTSCRVEPSLAGAPPGSSYQFERLGYFCVDTRDSSTEKLVFNRIVTLRDSWAKISEKEKR
jgi:glutaminyl-tRNA synthetase